MPRTLFGLLPVVTVLLFTLLMPGKVVADPPARLSEEMVVDEVCEGLRQYQKEKDEGKRVKLLTKLAPTRDPRVAVVLGDVMDAGTDWVGKGGSVRTKVSYECYRLLVQHYCPPLSDEPSGAQEWWKKNRDDLRRRAKQLPK